MKKIVNAVNIRVDSPRIDGTRLQGWLALLCLIGLIGTVPSVPVFADDETPLVMVVNKANPATVTKVEAKKLVLGQQSSWSDGKKVVVAMRPAQNPDRIALLKKLCGMSEAEYMRYEMQAVFTGQTPAKVVEQSTATAVKLFVKSNPGAVGFLHKSEVDADLKVALTID